MHGQWTNEPIVVIATTSAAQLPQLNQREPTLEKVTKTH